MSRRALLFPALAALVLAAVAIALASGPLTLTGADALRVLLHPASAAPEQVAAVLDIRLPRAVLALLVGAVLALSGTVMQALFRNPLAEPGLVGISSGAALFAAAALVLGGWIAPLDAIPQRAWLPVAAFAGALAATALVLRLALVDGVARAANLLLAGLAINAIAGAGVGLLSYIASDRALRAVMFWLFGSLGKAGWPEIAFGAPLLLATIVLLPRQARALDALLLGEAEAGHLGVDVERLKRRCVLLIVLGVGTAVSLSGVISFVGLVVPHLLRLRMGPGHRALLPASALLGGGLLLLADTAARTWAMPADMPVGIFTALIGGPFFLALLARHRRDAAL